MAALIPIPTLDPDSIPPPDRAIRAVVSLYWPYSSSTKQCALLLADRDFRLRSRKGQVRVRFTSASATAVAQGKVGIGDEVLLDLRGAQWASDSSRVATPGKSVEGELVYKGQLSLRIVKKAGSSEIVDHHLSVNESIPLPEEEVEPRAKQTPARDTRVSSLRSSLGGVDLVPIYSSPAFVRRQRLSGNNLVKEDVFDPFADVDRELENEQPRKRQRISDVSSWRFTDRSPSPEKQMPMEKVSDFMDMDTSTVDIRQNEGDIQLLAESRPTDAGHDLQRSPLKAGIDDGLKDNAPLPAKLSPLPRTVSDPDVQAQDSTAMLPPPLPKLQMPHDPFIEQSQNSQYDPDLPSEGPATPKLKAVPAYTLPLPSPFPQEAAQPPFESQSVAAQAATNPNAATVIASQNAVSESAYNDGVRLQINPSITALARQRRKASRSKRQNSEDTSPKDTTRSPSQPKSASQDDLNYVYPDIESANDTEEDEEMQNIYSQQVQSHARELLEREGVKTRDWVHQIEADEVIEDMGDEPETSSDEDFEEEESDESEEDNEMLSFQDEEQAKFQTPTAPLATPATPKSSDLRHLHASATKDDEALIDVSSRPSTQIAEMADRRTPTSASANQEADPQVDAAPAKPSYAGGENHPAEANTDPTGPMHVPTPSVPATTIKEASRALPPKTPAKTMQSLFGFSYGMDGTNDTPPPVSKPTPQSEKDQIMKRTYSSLFGFRASPSPEKERAPAPMPEIQGPETTFGRVKSAETSSEMVTGETVDVGTAKRAAPALMADQRSPYSPTDDKLAHTSPIAATWLLADNSDHAPPGHANIEALEPIADVEISHDPDVTSRSPESTIPESTPSQFAIDVDDTFDSLDVQLSEMSQPNQSPPVVEDEQQPTLPDSVEPHLEANRTAAGSNQFGSLEVQLSEMSDASENAEEEAVSQDDPLHSKRVGAQAVHGSQPMQDTSIVAETVKLAYSTDAGTPHTPISPVEVEPASQTEETDEPFDDEALVASMLNDATPRPLRTTDHDDIDMSLDTSSTKPVSQEKIKLEPIKSLSSATRYSMPPPPSTAPVRSLGSEKIHAPPPSTAPRPSQVEVIDLGSSDDYSDAQSEDDPEEEDVSVDEQNNEYLMHDNEESAAPAASQPPRASQLTAQDLMVDEPDDAQAYSPTEVASSPGVKETVDVEMQDAAFEQDDVVAAHNQLSPGLPQRAEDESLIPDARHESFFDDEMEASGFETPGPVPRHSQRQSQMSEAPSTQSRNIADQYHYFSFQNDDSDLASSDDEDDASELPSQISPSKSATIKEGVSQPKSTAQSEVIEISSSSPPPVTAQPVTGISEVKVAQSSEQSQVHESRNETSEDESQVLASSADRATPYHQPDLVETEVKHTPEVQVAASSFIEDSMDPARQPLTQLSLHARPPSPENSQLSQPKSALESQHQLESQPFETQLPSPASHQPILPPTSEITNEGLKVVVDTPEEPLSTTPAGPSTRKHKRNTSSGDRPTPVRRSPRKGGVQSEAEAAGQATTSSQIRSQRTASPDASQVITTRQTRSQRTTTPEAVHPVTSSFDSTLLTPEPAKPLRRSPRKSQAQTESSQVELRRKGPNQANEEEIDPPPKRITAAEKSSSENQQPTMEPAPLSSRKTPSKKSFTLRLGNVPEVISAWFSPRRSTKPNLDEEVTAGDNITNEKSELLQRTFSNGIVTSSAYYTPLSNLDEKLNPSSQPGVDNTIDILAVVADETKAPERAKGGPRDYFTIFKIVDASSPASKTFTSVDVFRPWHATLPVAKVGDVVLLRGFAVKSRKRQPYLLSTDASAWLVWRFDESDIAKRPGTATSPRRTRRSSVVGLGAREETKGPPVELGEEERQRAKELRAWWLGLSLEEKGEASK